MQETSGWIDKPCCFQLLLLWLVIVHRNPCNNRRWKSMEGNRTGIEEEIDIRLRAKPCNGARDLRLWLAINSNSYKIPNIA